MSFFHFISCDGRSLCLHPTQKFKSVKTTPYLENVFE